MLSTEIQDQLVQLVGLILAGVVAWVLKNVRDLIQKQGKVADEKLSAQQREALYPALQYAIAYARGTLNADDAAKLAASDKLKNHVVKTAVAYVRPKLGETLDALGITDKALEDLLLARLQNALDYLKIPAAK